MDTLFFVSENEVLLKRLIATENIVQELLQEVNLLRSQDKIRDKKVAHLEKQLRLQRQRNSRLDSIIKKLTSCDREQGLGPVELPTPSLPRKSGENTNRGK